VYIYVYIYAVLREVRKRYGILVGNLNVRLFVRFGSAWNSQLNWTVNTRRVVRWAGFSWLLIELSVRSRQGICRKLVSFSLSKMTSGWSRLVCVCLAFCQCPFS
jgi:hypothetical protein